MIKKILIATDGSPSALRAAELGLELAEEEGAQPIFVHVAPTKDVLPVAGIGMVPVSGPTEPRSTRQSSWRRNEASTPRRGCSAATPHTRSSRSRTSSMPTSS
jgi:nucleotide-binding universal stress UspA family protein